MNTAVKLAMIAALTMAAAGALSGCGFYRAVEKDTVMVRKIDPPPVATDTPYEGVLSTEAVKTLSVNAIGKYLDRHPAMDDLSFEVLSLDAPSVSQVLNNLYLFQSDLKRKYLIALQADDRSIVSPLYFVTVSDKATNAERIMVILHAETGEVLGIAKQYEYRYDDSVRYEKKEVRQLADDYLEKLGYQPSELELDQQLYYGTLHEYYYRKPGGKTVELSLTVDIGTNEIVSFLKDALVTLPFIGTPYPAVE